MPKVGIKTKDTDFKLYLDEKLKDKTWAKEFEEEYEKTRIAVEITDWLENPNYGNYTLKMLSRVVKALGRHLRVSISV